MLEQTYFCHDCGMKVERAFVHTFRYSTHVAHATHVTHATHATHATHVAHATHATHATHVTHATRVTHATHVTHVAQWPFLLGKCEHRLRQMVENETTNG
jgi:hypothetical protein